jgi:hypothetical protein
LCGVIGRAAEHEPTFYSQSIHSLAASGEPTIDKAFMTSTPNNSLTVNHSDYHSQELHVSSINTFVIDNEDTQAVQPVSQSEPV